MLPNSVKPIFLVGMILMISVLEHSRAAAARELTQKGNIPCLFTDSDDVTTASALDIAAKLREVDIVTVAGSNTPALKTTGINRAVLASQPPKLLLDLPNTVTPTTINIRRGLSTKPSTAGSAEARLASAAAAGISQSEVAEPGVWVGEVKGAPGALSTVVLVTSETGAVYGDIRYYDRRAKQIRSFKIVPVTDQEQLDATVRTSASGDNSPALYPKINPNKYIVVEYKESQGQRRFVIPPTKDSTANIAAAASESTGAVTVDTTPKQPVAPETTAPLPGFDALLKPAPTPEELAAAKEASAGPTTNLSLVTDSGDAIALAGSPMAVNATFPNNSTAISADTSGSPSGRRKLQQSSVRQDVLIVYTAAGASRIGGVDAMRNKARENIARANKVYADSGIGIVLNLVDVRQLGADLVAMFNDIEEFRDGGKVCGWGYVPMPSPDANWGFSEVLRGCYDGFTFTHELGHNQGCGHMAGTKDQAQASYGFGWNRCDLGNSNFKTIMASWCTGSRTAEGGLFATPARSFNGIPAGDANRGHCARLIQETATRVRDYRAERVAPPTPPPSTGMSITLKLNGAKCVDAPSYNNGARVHVWDCHGGSNQQWETLADGSVRIPGTNKCLDVSGRGTADGTAVHVWDCNGGTNQKWFLDPMGRLHPWHAPNMCLDVPNGGTSNGNGFQIWNCQGNNNNQVFNAAHFPRGFSPNERGIKSRLNNRCLDVYGFTYQDGGPVAMWDCNGQANQLWFADTAGGLRTKHNGGFCLDASGSSSGTTVYIFKCHWKGNQQWFMDPLGRLRPYQYTDKCLDIRGASANAGVPVQLWDCLDAPQQKWYV